MHIGKFFLCSFFFLFFGLLTAAKGFNQRVAQYYLSKNKAELSIVNGHYGDALKQYKHAFRLHAPLARDLFNAFVVAYYEKDTAAAQSYYNGLVLHGYEKRYFEGLAGYNDFVTQILKDPFYAYLSRPYDSLLAVLKRSDLPVKAAILDSIMEIDQNTRLRGYEDGMNRKSYRDSLAETDHIAIRALIGYCRQYGFPGFDQVGLCEKRVKQPMNLGTFYSVFWHQRGHNKTLDAIARTAVMNGAFEAQDYAVIADQYNNRYDTVLPENYASLGFRLPAGAPIDEVRVNRDRAAIYLESLADYRKKMAFQKKDNRFYLVNMFAYGFNNGQPGKSTQDHSGTESVR